MGGFLAELRRRHIFRIGAVYVVIAWGIIQVLDVLSQLFALPDWIAQPAVVVLAIGFPVTLIAAWMIVGAANREDPAQSLKATGTDWLIGGGLIAVLLAIGYQQFAPRAVEVADTMSAEVAERLPNSIAVLPFANLSSDPENAHFAAGIHDTLLNELAKISDMNVISRTSVLRYADGQTPIPQIAEDLNVETVMEGTVQYAEGRVLVTTQLIDPETEAHLWSENYDREFEGIFAIQADIAMNIANALEAELLPRELESIETPPTESPDALSAFLRAMAVIRSGTGASVPPGVRMVAQTYLDEAIAIDPEFALAHAWKAVLYNASRNFDPVTEEDWPSHRADTNRLTITHAETALAFDSTLGLAHAVLADNHFANWRATLARTEAEQALELSPNDPDVLRIYARMEAYVLDRRNDSIEYLVRAAELDPSNVGVLGNLGSGLAYAGRYAEATEVLQDCLAIDPANVLCALRLARSEFGLDNIQTALDALGLVDQLLVGRGNPALLGELAYGYRILDRPQEAQRIFEEVENLAEGQLISPANLAWAYIGVGNYEGALELLKPVAENPELLRNPFSAHHLRMNLWSDPVLEQPEWVDMRNTLGFR